MIVMRYERVMVEATAKMEIYHSLVELLKTLESDDVAAVVSDEMLRYRSESDRLFQFANSLLNELSEKSQ